MLRSEWNGRMAAVVDIGSSALRLLVAERLEDGSWHALESLERPCELGRDVFLHGEIGPDSFRHLLLVLTSFRESLRAWQVPDNSVRVIGTSALREALNRDTVVDRVNLRTGFQIEVIEGVEASRLTYLAVESALAQGWPGFQLANTLVVEVSGGSTEVLLLHRGAVASTHTLALGTVRIGQQLRGSGGNEMAGRVLEDAVQGFSRMVDSEFPLSQVNFIVAIGGELRFAARRIGKEITPRLRRIEGKDFLKFTDSLRRLAPDEIARRHGLSPSDAASLFPALKVVSAFLQASNAKNLLVPDASIRDGVLDDLARGGGIDASLAEQIIASAWNVARKYHCDEDHARHTREAALTLFDALAPGRGLDASHRLILEVAAILHDSGRFIATSSHHKHSLYIIRNTEIFGLSPEARDVAANVARYHRKSAPSLDDKEFAALERDQRLAVVKLAAILRVADALDSGERSRAIISKIEIDETEGELRLYLDRGDEAASAVRTRADMMEDVFGLHPRLISRFKAE